MIWKKMQTKKLSSSVSKLGPWECLRSLPKFFMNLLHSPLALGHISVIRLCVKLWFLTNDADSRLLNGGLLSLRSLSGEPNVENMSDITGMQTFADVEDTSLTKGKRECHRSTPADAFHYSWVQTDVFPQQSLGADNTLVSLVCQRNDTVLQRRWYADSITTKHETTGDHTHLVTNFLVGSPVWCLWGDLL